MSVDVWVFGVEYSCVWVKVCACRYVGVVVCIGGCMWVVVGV